MDPGPEVRWGQDEEDPWLVARLTLTDKEKLALLAEHLRIESVELVLPDEPLINGSHVNGTQENGRRDEEGDSSPDRGMSCTGGKSKKGKLQTVAKQFGELLFKNFLREQGHNHKLFSKNLFNRVYI